MSGILNWLGFGGENEEQEQDMRDRRSQYQDSPSSNTRGNQRQTGGSGNLMHFDDQYTGNVHGGGGAGYGNQYGTQPAYGSQQGNQWQSGQPQHGDQWGRGRGNPAQHQQGFGTGQAQSQGHIFRSAQASKQMVYDVYGNCLAMLEELESRELKNQKQQPLPRSDIPLPNQKKFDDSTVRRKVETQLLLFQSQLSSCDKQILDEVREDLRQNTLVWNSHRENRKVPEGMTDHFVGKLFEVLAHGQTEHPKEFYQQPSIGEEGMRNAMQGIMDGNERRANLDEQFRKDPKKKAKGHEVRPGGRIDQDHELAQ